MQAQVLWINVVVSMFLDCPILIQGDASISRKHSVLTVQHDVAHLVINVYFTCFFTSNTVVFIGVSS